MDTFINLVFYDFIGCITKNAPCYSKADYTVLQFCNHDTIKIHFLTVEKQQAKDKQLSFKTNTHSLLWIKLIHTVRLHTRILGLITMRVLCIVHEDNSTTHHNSFIYTLEPTFSVVYIGSRHCCHAWHRLYDNQTCATEENRVPLQLYKWIT